MAAMPARVEFDTTVKASGNNTGIVVPNSAIDQLGAGRRPPVVVNMNGYEYRSTVAVMGVAPQVRPDRLQIRRRPATSRGPRGFQQGGALVRCRDAENLHNCQLDRRGSHPSGSPKVRAVGLRFRRGLSLTNRTFRH